MQKINIHKTKVRKNETQNEEKCNKIQLKDDQKGQLINKM
jgi:hypothetical protein